MAFTNSRHHYGIIAKLFHWLLAIAIFGMFALGLWMEELPMGADKFKLYGIHKSIGALILAAVVLRYLWRLLNTTPILPPSARWHERLAAHAAHYGLYLLMFCVPFSGWLMSSAAGFPVSVFGWFTLPNLTLANKELKETFAEAHELLAFGIMALVAVHIVAALYHHCIRKDSVLKRMLPW